MLTMMDRRLPAVETVSPAPAPGEPMYVFAALIDSLTSPERYSLEARNGELFITPARIATAARGSWR